MVTRETILRQGLQKLGLVSPSDAVARLLRFHDLLLAEAVPRGLVGPSEAGRLVERHILESAALAPIVRSLLPSPTDPVLPGVLDVGSGAGLPGIVLDVLLQTRMSLLDGDRKRTEFLERVCLELSSGSAVVCLRAEIAARDDRYRDSFDLVVARALARPAVALELALPFVRPGGNALFAVGPSASEELPGLTEVCEVLAGGPPRLVPLQVPSLDATRFAMIVEKLDVTPDRYPRRDGVPARKPLGKSGR
jgi:16S rRNA (guanine527-N7)-methyltransferase